MGNLPNITTVYVDPLPDGGFRYFGLDANNLQALHLIRKKATRKYAYAYQYEQVVCSGPNNPLSRRFAFGSKPQGPKHRVYSVEKGCSIDAHPVKVFKIEELNSKGGE